MTTPDDRPQPGTPDARIAADWTVPAGAVPPLYDPLGYYAARKTVSLPEAKAMYEDIDTSTTAGKVAVMQAHAAGQACEWRHSTGHPWRPIPADGDLWNWVTYDYRIAPPAPARGPLALARECRAGMTTVDVTSPAGRLCTLVAEIDRSPAVWFGVSLLDQCGIIGAKPGRYRLVRDEP